MTHDQLVIALGLLIWVSIGLAVVHLVGSPTELMDHNEGEPEFDAAKAAAPQLVAFAVALVHAFYVVIWPVILVLAIVVAAFSASQYCRHRLRQHPFRGCADDECFDGSAVSANSVR